MGRLWMIYGKYVCIVVMTLCPEPAYLHANATYTGWQQVFICGAGIWLLLQFSASGQGRVFLGGESRMTAAQQAGTLSMAVNRLW